MKINIKRTPQTLLSVKILSVVGIAFLLYLIANLVYLRWASYNDIQNLLKDQNKRILNDLTYKNAKWDTSFYVSDNQLPQDNPLYVISKDGFIIDRNPIAGFLDFSDFKYSSSFQEPQTITTPANEVWRMYSRNIVNGGVPIGTIVVGRYQPSLGDLSNIDNQLKNGADKIASELQIRGDTIDASNVDVRSISVFISFEVVDTFNHALKSVGGVPSYIDRSYIPAVISEQSRTITDKSNRQFLTYSMPIISSNNPIGVVISGYSLQQVNKDLQNQLIFSISTGAVVIVILVLLLVYLLQRDIASLLKKAAEAAQKVFYVSHRGGAFGFDKDTGLIYLGDKKMEVPVKTLQYYVCKVLFSRPNKNWENDEIIDHLPTGMLESEALDMYEKETEDLNRKARAIYDAVRLLNEKAKRIFGYEVILIQGKTYRINPNIQPQNA